MINRRRLIIFAVCALLSVCAAMPLLHATGYVMVMDPQTKQGMQLKGGDGVDINPSTKIIRATGVPAGGVTDIAFKGYTGLGGGRATNDRADFLQGQINTQTSDPRFPTTDEKAAMTEATTPSSDNPFATRADLAFINYSATSVTVTAGGTATGSVTDTRSANDSLVYSVAEVAATPGFDVRFTFTGAGHFNQVSALISYAGSTTHDVYMQIYNYGTTQWDDLHPSPIHGTTAYAWVSFAVPDATAYVSGGAPQVRFYHSSAGGPTHVLYIDYLVLQHSTMGGATTLHSQLAGRSGADQHPTAAITGLDGALAVKADTSALGSAAYEDVTSFATAAEGGLAGTALQSGAPATSIANTPAGSVAATTVQGAINELEDEKGPRSHTITVCAANAFKTTDCDYQCDGIDDQVQFQQAIDSLDASGDYWYGGTIMASVGDFYFSDTATITSSYINVKGQGRGSRFVPRTNNFLFNAEKENKIYDGPFIDGGSKGRYRTNGVVFADIGSAPDVDYIAAASGDGTTVTIDTTLPHNLVTGQQVWLRSSHEHYNTDLYGVFTATVISPTRITIPSTASNFTELPLMSIAGRFIRAVDASQMQIDKIFTEGMVQSFKGEGVFDGWIINSNLMHSGAGIDENTSNIVLSNSGATIIAGFKILGSRIEAWGQGAGTQLLVTGPNGNGDVRISDTKFEGYRWMGDPLLLASYTAAGPTINLEKVGHYTISDNNSNGGCNTWLTVGSLSYWGIISDNELALYPNSRYAPASSVFSPPIVVNGSGNMVVDNFFSSRTNSAPAAITIGLGATNNYVSGNRSSNITTALVADNSGNATNKISKNAGDDVAAAVDGGTGLSSAIDDALMLGSGSAWQSTVVPDCDATSKKLNYDADTNVFTCVDEDGASSASSITAGDSSVAITDTGDGHVAVTEDGTEIIRVTGGSVGVGTASPDQKLEVVGNIATTEFGYGSELVTNGTFDADLSGWTTTTGWSYDTGHALHISGTSALSQSTTVPTLGKWYEISITVGGTYGGGTLSVNFGGAGKAIKTVGVYSFIMSANSSTTLSISTPTEFTGYLDDISIKEISNGAVYASRAIGIGTTTPTKSLQIESQGQSSALLRGSTGYGSTIELQHNETPAAAGALLGGVFLGAQHTANTFANSLEINGTSEGAWTTGSAYPSAFVFKTTASGSTARTERMRITGSGNVGIGTSAPEAQLDINSATGANLQLTYNDSNGSAANKVNFATSSTGDLTITPSGGDVIVAGNTKSTQFQDTPYAPSAGTTFNPDLNNGMVQEYTTTGNATINLPAPVGGKSYIVRVKYGGAHTVTFAAATGTISYSGGVAPTATSVLNRCDDWVIDSNAAGTYIFIKDGGRNFVCGS